MKAIEILRSKEINMQMTLEGVRFFQLDNNQELLIKYDEISPFEAALLRYFLAMPRVQIIPGVETNLILDYAEKQAEEALKKVKKENKAESKQESIVYDVLDKPKKQKEAKPFDADTMDPAVPTTQLPESKL